MTFWVLLRILVETFQTNAFGSQPALGFEDFWGLKSYFFSIVVGFGDWFRFGFGIVDLCLGQSTTVGKQKNPDVTKSWKVMAHVLETAVVLIWKGWSHKGNTFYGELSAMTLKLAWAPLYAVLIILGRWFAGEMILVWIIGASWFSKSLLLDVFTADRFDRPFSGVVAFDCLLGAFKLSRRHFGGSIGQLTCSKSHHAFVSNSRSTRSCSGRVSFQLRSRVLDKMVFPWLCVALCCRIGEAAVPGPTDVTFSIGVCNPSGLGAKAHLFDAQERADVWLVSESHLSSVGLRSFRRSLRALQSPYRWVVHGYPVQPRSVVSEIGQWTGVACVSQHPSRALVHGWEDGINLTSRIVGSTTFCCNTWLTGITVYGTPVGPTHPNAKQVTEQLLSVAIERIVQAVGCRFVAGDWNCDHSSLVGVAQLRALGFQDVQDLEFQRSAQCPLPTCRGKTRRDFFVCEPRACCPISTVSS